MRNVGVAVFAATALTSCSSADSTALCTKTGMDSGVAVVWRPADFGKRPDAATVRLCVDGTCAQRASGDPGEPVARLSVRLADDVGAATVRVVLKVTSGQDGQSVVVEDGRRARLTEQHPNGASCPPTAWTATFRADPREGLTSARGMPPRGG
jgi:hypothetical protein